MDGAGWSPRGGEGDPSDNLYICGLPPAFDTDSVQQFFSAIGNVIQCKSFGHGYALVRFSSMQEATLVKQSLHGQQPVGCTKPLSITYSLSEVKKDWYCPKCGDLQFQKNAQCRMCGTPRPADGATVETKGGLPHYAESGDWTCTSCGDLQFKKNTHCRLCGAPAPGGAGGGAAPFFGKGKGKGKGKDKGPMCTIEDFIGELIGGGLPGGDHDPNQNLVHISGLPEDTTEEHLYMIFAAFGAIPPRGVILSTDGEGKCNGSGSVNYLETTNADMAVMALNGIQLVTGEKMRVLRR